MIDESQNNKRIAKNTVVLYVRMLFVLLANLYISRIVLSNLGVVDYGIYNVIGGLVAMFSILSGSLSAAISRFMTFELGKGNKERLCNVFSSAVSIQIVMAIVVSILAEIIGVWFLNCKMTIPTERLEAANWVLHCSVMTFVINLISVPYNAAIIAHEHMKTFAYVGILEVALKVVVSLYLFVVVFDALKYYAIALVIVALIIRLIYGFYCSRHFEECRYKFSINSSILKEMGAFAGWNFIGSSSAMCMEHGVNMVINVFSGPALNAARGVGHQVSTALSQFASNFMIALNPQITKTYAIGDSEYLMKLLFRGSRFSFYLLLILSLPLLLETEYVMTIWLGSVPDHAINFARLFIVFVLSQSISSPLITVMLATGKIRDYQILVGGLQMLNLPISYILLKIGYFPEITVIVAIILSQCCLFARIVMLHKMINLSRSKFLFYVCGNTIIVGILSLLLPLLLHSFMSYGIFRFIFVTLLSVISTSITIYFVGCNEVERQFVRSKIKQRMSNL